ncbi:MAG: 1-(5-phosphoribosyl)-5-[(5-phosphoribosylamino)methylideneamino]imidazole-4-carboxamide isomerase [Thermodesulfobacteriota bacterium]
MIILPAIDIKEGRCVRLCQGIMTDETEYSKDPSEVAKRWADAGAEIIHIVDLDAAIEGTPKNLSAIEKIASSVNVPIQIGGGIRNEETAKKYLGIKGVKRVIIGTLALSEPGTVESLAKRYPGRIAIGIDAKDGFVAIKGWVEVTKTKAIDLAKKFEGMGVAAIIYTDISKDGMLTGPNVEATKKLIDTIKIPVIASGGVSNMKDIEALKKIKAAGAIVGKALYSGAIDLKEAIKTARD